MAEAQYPDRILFDDETIESHDFEADAPEDDGTENVDEIPKEDRILRTQAYDKGISDIVSMINNKDIILDPEYQRNYVWDNKKSSLLIESILLNVPIPVIYVAEDEDGSWSVVDGLQRLYSLKRFFGGEFKLRGLEVLKEFNGKTFSSLNPKAQRIIRNGILRVIVILKESHPEIKYDIFMRLNRGAIKLNEQELRNCLFRGKLNDLIMNLRQNPIFLKLLGLNEPHQRMDDAELVLRYLAVSENFERKSNTISNYGKMKVFLNKYCEINRNPNADKLKILEEKFNSTISKVLEIFGEKALYRSDDAGQYETRPNRSIYDCLMIGFENYEISNLISKREEILFKFRETMKESEFERSISIGTSDKAQLELRLSIWIKKMSDIMV